MSTLSGTGVHGAQRTLWGKPASQWTDMHHIQHLGLLGPPKTPAESQGTPHARLKRGSKVTETLFFARAPSREAGVPGVLSFEGRNIPPCGVGRTHERPPNLQVPTPTRTESQGGPRARLEKTPPGRSPRFRSKSQTYLSRTLTRTVPFRSQSRRKLEQFS